LSEVSPDQLKRAVEAQHGGTATLVQSVPVLEQTTVETTQDSVTFRRDVTVWEGIVHVFDLAGHPKASRAYAWSSERDDGKRRFYAVLHMGPVTGPVEAVRAAIVAERRDGR
jgi:hypothetical protein